MTAIDVQQQQEALERPYLVADDHDDDDDDDVHWKEVNAEFARQEKDSSFDSATTAPPASASVAITGEWPVMSSVASTGG